MAKFVLAKCIICFFRYSKKNWWVREEKSEYFPALEKDNMSLKDYLKRTGLVMVDVSIDSQVFYIFCAVFLHKCFKTATTHIHVLYIDISRKLHSFQKQKSTKQSVTWLGFCVDYIRQLIGQPEGFSFVITITGTAVLANVFSFIFKWKNCEIPKPKRSHPLPCLLPYTIPGGLFLYALTSVSKENVQFCRFVVVVWVFVWDYKLQFCKTR